MEHVLKKVLSNIIKQKRKEKACKWNLPLPKVRPVAEDEMRRVVRTGKRKSNIPKYPLSNVWDPYKHLGITTDASEEENRKKTKINLKTRLKKKVKESPPWVQNLLNFVKLTKTNIILRRLFLFSFMAFWSVMNSAEGGPAFQKGTTNGATSTPLRFKDHNLSSFGNQTMRHCAVWSKDDVSDQVHKKPRTKQNQKKKVIITPLEEHTISQTIVKVKEENADYPCMSIVPKHTASSLPVASTCDMNREVNKVQLKSPIMIHDNARSNELGALLEVSKSGMVTTSGCQYKLSDDAKCQFPWSTIFGDGRSIRTKRHRVQLFPTQPWAISFQFPEPVDWKTVIAKEVGSPSVNSTTSVDVNEVGSSGVD
ncbi:chaperone-like protein of POR1, chloroplastic [Tanacetum coccineum]